MIEKLTTKVSINTQGEAIRFANACYEVAEEFAIGFGEWLEILSNADYGTLEYDIYSKWDVQKLLEIYKKTL